MQKLGAFLKHRGWFVGLILLAALCLWPAARYLFIGDLIAHIHTHQWGYGFMHAFALLTLFVWAPIKIFAKQPYRFVFVLGFGALMMTYTHHSLVFEQRASDLNLYELYQDKDLTYESHVWNLISRGGDWLSFEEECVRPLSVNEYGNLTTIGEQQSSYCKHLSRIEAGYGINMRGLLVREYQKIQSQAKHILSGELDYGDCLNNQRCLLLPHDRIAISTTDKAISVHDMWCYGGKKCVILPLYVRTPDESNLLGQTESVGPNPIENTNKVYTHLQEQSFFTEVTCPLSALCSLAKIVGAPIR